MPKARAAAIALTPYQAAAYSLRNSANLLLDRLYGTQERVNATLAATFLMTILGVMLQKVAATAQIGCTF